MIISSEIGWSSVVCSIMSPSGSIYLLICPTFEMNDLDFNRTNDLSVQKKVFTRADVYQN